MVTMTTIQSPSAFLPIIEKMLPKSAEFQMPPETTSFHFKTSDLVR